MGTHQVWYKGRARRLVDGLGNNSPGIRPVGHRHPPLTGEGQRLADRFWQMVTSFVDGFDKKHRLKLIAELALGKRSSSPFSQQADLMRAELDKLVSTLGQDPRRRPGDVNAEVGFRRVRAWASLLEDAGSWTTWRAPESQSVFVEKSLGGGGVRQEGQVEVWDDKERERGHRDNYPSAKSHMEKVKEHVLET